MLLCVVSLLSIVNKDLLFYIIESYDCLVAGEAHLFALMHTQKRACLCGAFVVVHFQMSIFTSAHSKRYGFISQWWFSGGQVGESGSHWWSADFSVCVCVLDTFGARLVGACVLSLSLSLFLLYLIC